MKKIVLLLAITLCSVSHSFGQFKLPKKEDWVLASQLPIVVVLKEKDVKKVEKLTKNGKTEELELYNSYIDDYNTYLKKYVEIYWDKSLIHGYMTESEYKVFENDKKNKKKYTYITSKYNDNIGKAHSKAAANGSFSRSANFTNNTQLTFGILGLKFPMLDNGMALQFYPNVDKGFFRNSKKHAFKESDLKFSVNYFKNLINENITQDESIKKMSIAEQLAYVNRNAKDLKNLTLLVNTEFISDEFMKEFKSKYKYKYEIVSAERIENAILNNEEGYAYFHNHFQPSAGGGNYNLRHVYDTKSLKQLYYQQPQGGGVYIGPFNLSKKSKKTEVEELIEAIEK